VEWSGAERGAGPGESSSCFGLRLLSGLQRNAIDDDNLLSPPALPIPNNSFSS
jgi:hypothetical protein